MIRYVLRRIFQSLLTVFGVMVVTFLLFRVGAGDIAAAQMGQKATERQKAEWRHKHGYDLPYFVNIQLRARIYDLAGGPGALQPIDPPGSNVSNSLGLIVASLQDLSDDSPSRLALLTNPVRLMDADTSIEEVTNGTPLVLPPAPTPPPPPAEAEAPQGDAEAPEGNAEAPEGDAPEATDTKAEPAEAAAQPPAQPVEPRAALVLDLSDGSRMAFDLTGAKTVGDLLQRINEHPRNDASYGWLTPSHVTNWPLLVKRLAEAGENSTGFAADVHGSLSQGLQLALKRTHENPAAPLDVQEKIGILEAINARLALPGPLQPETRPAPAPDAAADAAPVDATPPAAAEPAAEPAATPPQEPEESYRANRDALVAAWSDTFRYEAQGKRVQAVVPDLSPGHVFNSQFVNHLYTSVTFSARSFTDNRSLREIIAGHARYSLALTVPAMVIGWVAALAIACIVAYYRGTAIDRVGVFLSVLGMCVPFLAFMIFGQWLMFRSPWPAHAYGIFNKANIYVPITIMVVAGLGGSVRFYRTIILDQTGQDYVRTARAKGAALPSVLFKHVLRNCMLPIMTNLIMAIPFLIMGSLLVESYFGIPGLGGLILNAVQGRDEPILNGMVFLTALVYTLAVLITDLSYGLFDPRIRLR